MTEVSKFSIFRRIFFCHTVPKKIVEKPFCVSGNFGYRKMLEIREGGGNHDFSSKLFCLRAPKLFVDEPFCAVFQNNSVSEKVYA